MIRSIAPALLAFTLTAPALADDVPSDIAETRLRGCLLAGASSADSIAGLEATIIRVRAYCGTQINRVRDQRVATATADLKGKAAQSARSRAIRALNAEIAQAVANFSGLTP